MKIAVVCSVYGNFDQLTAPTPQDIETDFILVSDRKYDNVDGWRFVVEPRPQLHPRLAAKVAKCNPEWYSDADVLIWVDGNVNICSPRFSEWCVESLGKSLLCQHLNPERTTVFSEVGMAQGMEKYVGLPLRAQAEHYVASGFPADYGTWWTGLMVRAKGCPDFGTAWMAEMVRWTYEDQVSQPYVLHSMGLRPADLEIPGIDSGSRLCEYFGLKHHYTNS